MFGEGDAEQYHYCSLPVFRITFQEAYLLAMKVTLNQNIKDISRALAHSKAFWCVLLAAGVIFNMALMRLGYVSEDYRCFVGPWISTFRHDGHWLPLAEGVGNYNLAYQYILVLLSYFPSAWSLILVKCVSFMFQLFAGVCCGLIVSVSRGNKPLCVIAASALMAWWPTSVMNSSVWAQCDMIYVSFLMLMLYGLLRQRNVLAMISFGMAFAFKLQALFFAPFLLFLLLRRELKWWQAIFVSVGVYILTLVPAAIIGNSWANMLGIYLKQSTVDWGYFWLYPNFYGIWAHCGLPLPANAWWWTICSAVLIFAVVWYWHNKMPRNMNVLQFLTIAMLLYVCTVYLLPMMHERYQISADVMVLPLMMLAWRKWLLPGLTVVLVSAFCYWCLYMIIQTKSLAYLDVCSYGAPLLMLEVVLIWIITKSETRNRNKQLNNN